MWLCSVDATYLVFFFFKQRTAYEMRISDWSSDVCSSDLRRLRVRPRQDGFQALDLGIPLQDFEAHPHLVDATVDRLQLGRLVDHEIRRGDLAAVVQQIGSVSCRERVCQYV